MNNWVQSGRSLVYIISVFQFIGGIGTIFMGLSSFGTSPTIGFFYTLVGVIYPLIGTSLWKFVKYFDSLEIVE